MSENLSTEIKEILSKFNISEFASVEPFGDGHINKTYKVVDGEQKYVLQKVNTDIFKNFQGIMDNIMRICEHLDSKGAGALKVINYSEPWRLYNLIENAYSLYVLDDTALAFRGAKAFAQFQNRLSDLPAPRLVETIPAFHNAKNRLRQFDEALDSDVVDRSKSCQDMIEFVQSRRHYANRILDLMESGQIPERITHNDTKINNVMFDKDTDEVVAVVDLDTVMPGSVLFDFGDMVRSASASAQEDETNLELVYSKPEYFQALVSGYLSEAKFLNQCEIDNLAFSGISITYTQVVRFLTDYLAGDTYYGINYPQHNLDRTRNQAKLLESLEENLEKYEQIVKDEASKLV